MIIPPKDAEAQAQSRIHAANELEAPPAYIGPDPTPSTSAPPIQQAHIPAIPPSVARVKPAKFTSLTRQNNAIRGEFSVDSSLSIPTALLPPLEKGETEASRKNLRLETRNGVIDVDIWLLGEDKGASRTTLDLRSHNGFLSAKVHTPTLRRSPFHLTTTVHNGSLSLSLPRSFQGILTITSLNGSVTLSEQVTELLTTFSEVNATRRCFLGDFSKWDENGNESEWSGDEVIADAQNGRVRVQFEDEVKASRSKGEKKGFFGKMFGL